MRSKRRSREWERTSDISFWSRSSSEKTRVRASEWAPGVSGTKIRTTAPGTAIWTRTCSAWLPPSQSTFIDVKLKAVIFKLNSIIRPPSASLLAVQLAGHLSVLLYVLGLERVNKVVLLLLVLSVFRQRVIFLHLGLRA
jgi:hypothetical protein